MNYYQQNEKTSYSPILMIAVIIVAGFCASYILSRNSASAQVEPLLTSTSNNDSPFSTEQLALLAKIQSIKLDGTFFKDPVFASLQDWTIQLGQEEAGRVNPFTPVEGLARPKLPAAR